MTTALSQSPPAADAAGRPGAARLVQLLMEGILLAAVAVAPWFFGAVEPDAELALDVTLAVLLALWGERMLAAGRFSWRRCPVGLCLAGLFLLAVVQLLPLPRPLLARLSPATAELYDLLLPAKPEVLAEGADWRGDLPPAGITLSIDPAATRREGLRLLAVFLLFALVRNNLTGGHSLRRLAWVALANGALLSLVALVQLFTSRHDTVYWTWRSAGSVFGPFICRNHFPFYANLCLGLGLGLLLATQTSGRRGALRDFLRQPHAAWLAAGLGLVLTGVLFSLSRGGFVALLGAAAVCLLLKLCVSSRPARQTGPLWGAAVALALAVAVVYVFGQDQVTGRLATIWQGDALQEGRGPIWERALAVAREFPVWGTGYGTFQDAEMVHRTSAADANLYYVNAHNDYLDALAEGGVLRLGLSLVAIVLLFGYGVRAVRRWQGTSREGLAWGLVFAFATLVIHSFVDFGIHLPAIAVLATVIAAHLAALGDRDDDEAAWRLGGLAPVGAAGVALALGLLLAVTGWEYAGEARRRTAAEALKDRRDPEALARRLALLGPAAAANPDSSPTQLALARAYLDRAARATEGLEQTARVREAALMVLGPTMLPGAPSVTGPWAEGLRLRQHRADVSEATGADLLPALAACLRARDACPLQDEANLTLARYARLLERADPPETYLARAQFAAPANPLVWLLSGQQEAADALRTGDPGRALRSWRRSLELSDRYLDQILGEGTKYYQAEELLAKAIPDEPALLWQAARKLYPEDDQAEQRAPALQRALAILDERGGRLDGPGCVVKAKVCEGLGRLPEAAAAYRQALELEPNQVAWRFDLARLLYEQGQGSDARRELQFILNRHPRHEAAQALLTKVARLIAEKE